jgi:hypothetical protein
VTRALFATAALGLLLSACSSPKLYWYKNEISAFDTANVESECKFQVGLSKVKEDQVADLVQHCMQAKGFRQRTDKPQ